MMIKIILVSGAFFLMLSATECYGQTNDKPESSNSGWFSLGGRSTLSSFSHDGTGLGTGGQFRIQFSERVNSDWFADYITINIKDRVRSEYYHIGWSILYYPIERLRYPLLFQPYILAGHCFDYNRKTIIQEPTVSKSRWGSAVQVGVGSHLNLSEKFDVSFTCQYMMHFTRELESEINGDIVSLADSKQSTLEGHLLTTISMNYKVLRLWKKD
jgi:hypothetical protein